LFARCEYFINGGFCFFFFLAIAKQRILQSVNSRYEPICSSGMKKSLPETAGLLKLKKGSKK
jgi:hypothetical protein